MHVFIMVSLLVANPVECLLMGNMERVPHGVQALLNNVLYLLLKSLQYCRVHSYKKVVLRKVLPRPHGGRQMFLLLDAQVNNKKGV